MNNFLYKILLKLTDLVTYLSPHNRSEHKDYYGFYEHLENIKNSKILLLKEILKTLLMIIFLLILIYSFIAEFFYRHG